MAALNKPSSDRNRANRCIPLTVDSGIPETEKFIPHPTPQEVDTKQAERHQIELDVGEASDEGFAVQFELDINL